MPVALNVYFRLLVGRLPKGLYTSQIMPTDSSIRLFSGDSFPACLAFRWAVSHWESPAGKGAFRLW